MRTDLLTRLKALGADDRKIAALADMFDDDTIADLLGQVEATQKAAADMQIAYKEQDMASVKQEIPAYTEKAYQLCDVLDRLAEQRGDVAAEQYTRRLLGQATREYPRAAQAALDRVQLAVYKAMAADPIDQLGQEFLALLREAGDDEARAWLEDAIAGMEADEEEAPAMQPRAKLTDSGAMSKKAYVPANDPWALASGADQVQPSAVQSLDMRPLG